MAALAAADAALAAAASAVVTVVRRPDGARVRRAVDTMTAADDGREHWFGTDRVWCLYFVAPLSNVDDGSFECRLCLYVLFVTVGLS